MRAREAASLSWTSAFARLRDQLGEVAEALLRARGEQMSVGVLIVDDHPSFRATARLLLESEGFDVVGESCDGASGLRAAQAIGPDLVLLDVQLPDSDGFEVAAQLTGGAGGPAVVLTSSRDESDFGPLVAASGARGFVPKAELSGSVLRAILARA
jgi:DNA-binding NarL/FixJ family response regulator